MVTSHTCQAFSDYAAVISQVAGSEYKLSLTASFYPFKTLWRFYLHKTTMALSNESFRHDLLCRLRWRISSPVASIAVFDGLDENEKEIHAPFQSHTIFSEPLADLPLRHIQVYSGNVSGAASEQLLNDDCADTDNNCASHNNPDNNYPNNSYPENSYLEVKNDDGSAITIGQFVTAAHSYLAQYVDVIREFETPHTWGTVDEYGKEVEHEVRAENTEILFESVEMNEVEEERLPVIMISCMSWCRPSSEGTIETFCKFKNSYV